MYTQKRKSLAQPKNDVRMNGNFIFEFSKWLVSILIFTFVLMTEDVEEQIVDNNKNEDINIQLSLKAYLSK